MRICLLHQPLIVAGGAERQALEEARALSAAGHDVTVLTFRLEDAALIVEGIGRSEVETLRGRTVAGRVLALRRALRRGCDLLVSHSSPELAWLATRATRVPYVAYHNSPPFYRDVFANPSMASRRYRRALPRLGDTLQSYAAFETLPRLGPVRRAAAEARTALKHRALRDAAAVIVLSERTRRELHLLHGVQATVVRGCLPSVLVENPPRRAPLPELASAGAPVILSVCRLEAVKRVDLLIRAFAAVAATVPRAILVVAGAGCERERLVALAARLGLAERTRFTGYLPERDLWSHYAAAKVFASPAMADFNIAPYEALAMGCNVVWTTEMETDPTIEASGRVLVAPPDERAFGAALVEALRADEGSPPDLRAMTWEARGRYIDRLYTSLVSATQRNR